MDTLIKQALVVSTEQAPQEELLRIATYFDSLSEGERGTLDRQDRGIHRYASAAVAANKPIIDMRRLIEAGGFDDRFLPALTLSRARYEESEWWVRRMDWGRMLESWRPWGNLPAGVSNQLRWSFRSKFSFDTRRWMYASEKPFIPIAIREAVEGWQFCYVVHEANWVLEGHTRTLFGAGDPLLVRHLCGNIWSIEASWDMTELEAFVTSL